MRPAAAVVRGASLQRGEAFLLDGVDLTVRAGERWALLGRNGCGKTTLLSLVGALQHPTAGTVDVLGHRMGRVDIFRELWPRIGHLQGRHVPSGRLTAQDVVLTGLTGTNGLVLRWQPTAAQREQARRSLGSVGVQALADQDWGTLSNGEQRRTLIARALVKVPDLLLLENRPRGWTCPRASTWSTPSTTWHSSARTWPGCSSATTSRNCPRASLTSRSCGAAGWTRAGRCERSCGTVRCPPALRCRFGWATGTAAGSRAATDGLSR